MEFFYILHCLAYAVELATSWTGVWENMITASFVHSNLIRYLHVKGLNTFILFKKMEDKVFFPSSRWGLSELSLSVMFLKLLFFCFKKICTLSRYGNSHIGKYLANAIEIIFYVFPFLFLFFSFIWKFKYI